MSHQIQQCKHGVVYSQCRCPTPNKHIDIVDCTWTSCEVGEDELLEEIAELIILDHAKDIEYSSVMEMVWDDLHLADLTEEERDERLTKIDKLIQKAKVTVTFK